MKENLKRKKLLLAILEAFSLTISGCKEQTIEENVEKLVEESKEEKKLIKENIDFTPVINQCNYIKDLAIQSIEEPPTKEITISAVGDCTLGRDDKYDYPNSLPYVLEQNEHDYSYFFSGVQSVLGNDDLTIANLEGPFTTFDQKRDKKFTFKGDLDYPNILIEGSVEAVNLANNHMYDYQERGYLDTLKALEEFNVPYFGYDNYLIKEIDGIKIGMAGILGWTEEEAKNETDKAIAYLKENDVNLIIMTYHWGIEREYKQNSTQENIAHYAIDLGADLVLGHHPHVLQGIEYYNGKYIVYSLGNFVFGGNKNPSDKDTMIFQITYSYENGEIKDITINIIPCSLSSVNDKNDYQPTILEGEEKERVLNKVLESSTNLEY